MITTREAVKLLAGITTAEYNDLIDVKIPAVANLIHTYTNNKFISSFSAPHLLVAGEMVMSGQTLTSGVSLAGFKVADNIAIRRSVRNSGYFTIAEINNNVITVREQFSEEERYLEVYLVLYSKSIMDIAARMVAYDVTKRGKAEGLKSQNVGTWSGTYGDIGILSYPNDIVSDLSFFRLHTGA